MPKERRGRSVSVDRSRASPYPCSSSSRARRSSSRNPLEPVENVKEWEDAKRSSSKQPLVTLEDVKEWEEARCPVCMEHPHNAVLLLCSSHDKGCRPYMCDTSYRHSNCLDQFRRAFAETPSVVPPENEAPQLSGASQSLTSEIAAMDGQNEVNEEEDPEEQNLFCEGQLETKLLCPLCRGKVNGWVVVEAARQFMNVKARSCSCETCDFFGTYADLRKHARLEHPLVRPTEVDPERQRNWRRLEQERDLGDVVSTIQSAFGDEMGNEYVIPFSGRLIVFLLYRVQNDPSASRSPSAASRIRWQSGASRIRAQPRSRRQMTLWGESYDSDNVSAPREGDNETLESMPILWQQRERSRRRRTTPDNEP
ncbi:PREDICTED: uncharacterized protein LOC104595337 [Nelumbo nucifera]|uniref:Uncharacterized protein n=2 Tax=Nelumbo nucifera TaxID=4432 RepID=A0A822Y639_NELNU|nr:PREDICTED: uncharacterized protein LOC104595337 [Nelumbo nucifera]DAD27091.1 TPA_asm: hypothetical protein HUJ06_028559 [Nelumbo nucifera]